jgi:Ca2+-binding RTX toxin-like protein
MANAIHGNGGDNRLVVTQFSTDAELYGYGGNDTLIGAGNDDWLDGGANIDAMYGHHGNDTYIVNHAADVASEVHEGVTFTGYDTVKSYISYTLPDFIERLQFFDDPDAIQGVGNSLNNELIGNSYNNYLYGMAGDDTIWGQDGRDRIWGGSGIDTLYGGSDDDRLYGESNDDWLYGDAGNDELDGGSGADVMRGGRDDDTYFVGNAGDQVIEYADQGRDTVFSRLVEYTLTANVEDMVLEAGALNGTGNARDNQIVGSELGNTLLGLDGDDTLYGMEGADTLNGGLGGTDHLHGGIGNDSYIIRDRLDVIHEDANEGIDEVTTTLNNYQLGANVENLTLVTGSYGLGNGLANTITGNAGANTLDGQGGVDTLIGGRGSDMYVVDNAADVVIELAGEGDDDVVLATSSYTLASSASVERLEALDYSSTTAINLTGNGLANTVHGNAGSNLINGGYGNDTLIGGGGQDYFMFNTAIRLSPNVDTIADFDPFADMIYLDDAVFSAFTTPGNLAQGLTSGQFHVGTAAHDADDRIIYDNQSGALLYDADGTGAASAVQFATLDPGLLVSYADFLVV